VTVKKMIEAQTVLILGAGASAPYGFPSGYGLVGEAIQLPHDSARARMVTEASGTSLADLQNFSEALKKSDSASVDVFLEGRSDLITIGKAAIAAILIPSEREDELFGRGARKWYGELLGRMGGKPEEIEANKLSIVTFNYDRSLEHYLITAVQHRFSVPRLEAAHMLRNMKIVHVHGELGRLEGDLLEEKRPYAPDLNSEAIRTAAESIKIIHEDMGRERYPWFTEAQDLISTADDVICLGFGYHPTNMKRLRFDLKQNGNRLRGTRFGVASAEQSMIVEFMRKTAPNIRMRLDDCDALAYLREHWKTTLVARD
jgi:hypothetical protein